MTLIATINKQSVKQLTSNDYLITIHVLITNELEEVILEKDYSERYYSALNIDAVKVKLQDQIVIDWNRLVAESNIYNVAAFSTMVTEIQTVANNYINT